MRRNSKIWIWRYKLASIFDELTAAKEHAEVQEPLSLSDDEQGASVGIEPVVSYTSRQIKDACQELLKLGLLESTKKPNLYRTAISQFEKINLLLEPLDLALRVDDIRGLAYLVVAEQVFIEGDDEWSHPLVRRQRLTLDQSLVLALLRQHYVAHEQQAGIGAGDALITLDDLLPQVQLYFGELGSDSREQQRLRTLLEKLKPHGVVSDIDAHDQVSIRPIIVHLANPENLQRLLHAFKAESVKASAEGMLPDNSEDSI